MYKRLFIIAMVMITACAIGASYLSYKTHKVTNNSKCIACEVV